ncbi:adenosylcobinamide-GDP ribazoletransferase [Spongiactinospora sp. TRM90649]|uniref:adenosylcobinamide-GDP ribazoletransferase n=1 Tax=Spongiactinospora sp. TRM90649 TaxID=3031114 RepID=UPI0023F73A3A|nr:adenosylcobinamide-GDP ribazoletransferase [Spongiactinospora sp. TRM90649]MDF5758520.1 adenosylcobinamide-GDP ribazoletransferase [Spongiactinospora sp. TRM90649]
MSREQGAWTGLRFALGMLTVLPAGRVEVDRRVAGRGMAAAPLIGALVGVLAAVAYTVSTHLFGAGLLPAVLTLATLALLTRALHLDGLADLADGLGSGKPPEGALTVMRRSDIGPFGVVTLCLVLLLQGAALLATAVGAVALITACVSGRLAITLACRRGVPAARPEGLGALVAGSVGPWAAIGTAVLSLGGLAFLGLMSDLCWLGPFSPPWSGVSANDLEPGLLYIDPSPGLLDGLPFPVEGLERTPGPFPLMLVLPVAALAGLAAAWAVGRRAVNRLGGVTGDVLGALVEVTATAALLVCAALT